jgi:hypothetical protein
MFAKYSPASAAATHSVIVLAYSPVNSSSLCWSQDVKQYSGLEVGDELAQRVAEASSQRSKSQLLREGVKHVRETMRYLVCHEVWTDVHYLYS